jgi:hypothetical protein
MLSLLHRRALVKLPVRRLSATGISNEIQCDGGSFARHGGKNLARAFPGLQYFPFANGIGSSWAL